MSFLENPFLQCTGAYNHWAGLTKVTRYNMKGFVEDLPDLVTGRFRHGCAGYWRHGQHVRYRANQGQCLSYQYFRFYL